MLKKQLEANLIIIVCLVAAALVFQLGVFKIPPQKLLMVLVGIAVFIIAFVKTNLSLGILIVSMLLSPEFGVGSSPGRSVVLRLDDVLLFTIFFGWLAKMAVNKELGLVRRNPLTAPIFLYIFVCLFSSLYGVLVGSTTLKYSFFVNLKYIEYFLIFFVVCNNLSSRREIKAFLSLMLITCCIVCFYAMIFTADGRASAPFEGEAGEPNTLAGYLVVMMGTVIGLALFTPSFQHRFVFLGLAGLMGIPLVMTLSRTGWLGFMMMYTAFIFLSRRYRGVLLLTCICMVCLAPWIMPKSVGKRIDQTFSSGKKYDVGGEKIRLDESAGARIRSWEDSVERWFQRPFIGYGVASGRVLYDMQYGRLLREIGAFGFLAFCWMVLRLFCAGFRCYLDEGRPDFDRGLSLGFICSLAGLLAMGVGAEVFIIIRIMEPFWFIAAMVVSLPLLDEDESPEAGTPAGIGQMTYA